MIGVTPQVTDKHTNHKSYPKDRRTFPPAHPPIQIIDNLGGRTIDTTDS